jgi:hypothetical protein
MHADACPSPLSSGLALSRAECDARLSLGAYSAVRPSTIEHVLACHFTIAWWLEHNQCSKILKLPCTTTFSKMLPGGMSMVLPSVATMMTVPGQKY